MAIDDLVGALERAAAAEAEALLAGARAEADIRVAGAALEWRGRVLAERVAALERLRQAVTTELPSLLAGAGGERLFDLLAGAALAATAGEPGVARCPRRFVDRCRTLAAAWPQVRVDADDAAGAGVLVDVGDGRLLIAATLEVMLQRWWPQLRLEAVEPAVQRPERVAV